MLTSVGQTREFEASLPDFQAEIDAITSRGLTPENVTCYADEALGDLVNVVQEVFQAYDQCPTIGFETGTEKERAAFTYWGLDADSIETTLDHIASVAESTRHIDALIAARTSLVETVILPPDTRDVPITPGDGSLELPKESLPKLKTILLLLEQQFGVDLAGNDLRIAAGILRDDMMRSQTYYMLEVPSLQRLVLVCDETGNATFVLDTDESRSRGLSPEDIANQSKQSLTDALQSTPALGRKIRYSQKYVARLAEALGSPLDDTESAEPSEPQLLKPAPVRAPEGYLSANGIATVLGVSDTPVRRAVKALNDELGDILQARFGKTTTSAYSPEQQEKIRQFLSESGAFAVAVPEGYMPVSGIASVLRVAGHTVRRTVKALNDELGDILQTRVGNGTTDAYSPEQQEKIRQFLSERGALTGEPPEGYLSAHGIADELGVGPQTVLRAVQSLNDELGDILQAKFGKRSTSAFSPEQQEKIRQFLSENGVFAIAAPEGYLSVKGIAAVLGVSDDSVRRAVQSHNDELGDILQARFGANTTSAFSPEQQASIVAWLQESTRIKL